MTREPFPALAKGSRLKVIFGVFALCSLGLWVIQLARGRLLARTPPSADDEAFVSAYAATLVKFEATEPAPGGAPHLLGFGFSAALEEALKTTSPAFQKCRQHFREGTGPVTFQVKVRPQSQRLRVAGILRGVEGNPVHAACLRDALEGIPFAFLSETPQVNDEKYTLQVSLTSALSSDFSGGR
ncbi:MAG: hypothetical protein IOD12_01430 [Silvanigrellales bacterium]|nr:hypothetical protein [Silvanigrellales bacterium]